MDLVAVREAISSAANTITGLRTSAYPVDAATAPIFMVGDADLTYDVSFGRGLDEIVFTCWLYVSRASDRSGHVKVAQYMLGQGALSLKAAVEVDRKLGGLCSTLHVRSAKSGGVVDISGNPYFGAEFTIYVAGSGA